MRCLGAGDDNDSLGALSDVGLAYWSVGRWLSHRTSDAAMLLGAATAHCSTKGLSTPWLDKTYVGVPDLEERVRFIVPCWLFISGGSLGMEDATSPWKRRYGSS